MEKRRASIMSFADLRRPQEAKQKEASIVNASHVQYCRNIQHTHLESELVAKTAALNEALTKCEQVTQVRKMRASALHTVDAIVCSWSSNFLWSGRMH
jgi:hypothetical protein